MADHKAPGQYVCDGVVLPGIVSRDVLERMKQGFTFDDSDVIIASYPKSGEKKNKFSNRIFPDWSFLVCLFNKANIKLPLV